MNDNIKPVRPGVLSLTIKDKNALYASYMPFVKGGGIFVPSAKAYKLGDEIFMLLTLMDNKEKIPVAGHVVWVTPPGAQGNRAAGVGIQFSEKDVNQHLASARSKTKGVFGIKFQRAYTKLEPGILRVGMEQPIRM